ncbi:hypothetical protein MLD38_016520 [Melastoma candidum]|uniref:Uncharacterized protein n=2 Tax=Melastoma candidum TaxID=119954 RepID=A0ACB9QLV6_9MYRT|nr:hypothetical protein MLD38_016516 [Melastoma candidum]KAI4367894.1 hypothetical protein MLD38_016520 [Melastoma candidum]
MEPEILPDMEGPSSSTSFPRIVDFLPLHSYFDFLQTKLDDPVLLDADEDLREQLCRLKNNQHAVQEWVDTILRDMFGASLFENPKVAGGAADDIAALNLVLRSFLAMEDRVLKKTHRITENCLRRGKTRPSGEGDLIVPALDTFPEDAGAGSSSVAGGDETRSRGREVIAMLLRSVGREADRVSAAKVVEEISSAMEELESILHQGMESDSDVNESGRGPGLDGEIGCTHPNEPADDEPVQLDPTVEEALKRLEMPTVVREINRRAKLLEARLIFALKDIVQIAKKHENELPKMIKFKVELERMCSDGSVPRTLAAGLQEIDVGMGSYQGALQEQSLMDEILDGFKKGAVKLQEVRNHVVDPEIMAERISELDAMLLEADGYYDEIRTKMFEMKGRVKHGLIVALAKALGGCFLNQ